MQQNASQWNTSALSQDSKHWLSVDVFYLTMEYGSSSTRPATLTSISTLSANTFLRGERNGVSNHNKEHGKERQGQRWQKKDAQYDGIPAVANRKCIFSADYVKPVYSYLDYKLLSYPHKKRWPNYLTRQWPWGLHSTLPPSKRKVMRWLLATVTENMIIQPKRNIAWNIAICMLFRINIRE